MTARPLADVDARAGRAGEQQQREQRPEAVRVSRGDERAAAAAEPGREHEPLAEPVGERAPTAAA